MQPEQRSDAMGGGFFFCYLAWMAAGGELSADTSGVMEELKAGFRDGDMLTG
jgi:hypothetical protein